MRSEKLKFYNIVTSKENCWNIINKLGNLKCIHFKNINKYILDKDHVNKYKWIEDILFKINDIESILEKYKVEKEDKLKKIDKLINNYLMENKINEEKLIFIVDSKINEYCNKIKNYEVFLNDIKNKIIDLHNDSIVTIILDKNLKENLNIYNIKNSLSYYIGIIKNSDLLNFQKLIFRLTKGNIILLTFPIDYKDFNFIFDINFNEGETIIFISFKNKKLVNILDKIFMIFNIKRRFIPSNIKLYLNEIKIKLNEAEAIYNQTKNTLIDILIKWSSSGNIKNISLLSEYRYYIIKERNINSVINKMKFKNSLAIGKFWIPVNNLNLLDDIIETNSSPGGIILKEIKNLHNPPTYIPNNKFLNGFQAVVNIYGIPNYKEINPGFFTIVSFPFLFGVMFGDIFHGIILLLFGYYLIKNSTEIKKISKNIDSTRYFIFMMGIFSVYNGFIYNDFTSIYPNIFGSCYHNGIERKPQCAYIFGIDPIWGISKNDIEFSNSYKMKISIIIGVIHMAWGIILKGKNFIYNKDYISFIFEFIPQIIFFLSIFGYLVILIISKWLINWGLFSSTAPSIIEVFILFYDNPKYSIINNSIFQGNLQKILMVLIFLSIPIMLFPKPLIIYYRNKNKKQNQQENLFDNENSINIDKDNKKQSDNLIEILIHQFIETIEFVLGCVSNTASYLRLWALSLAHAQLSKVFFDLLLAPSILFSDSLFKGTISVFIIFNFFILITFFVLLLMDVLECFLHALRLHWVEFQNKFYKGDGYLFTPINFKNSFINSLNK